MVVVKCNKNFQKGVSLLLTVIILGIVLAMVVGLGTILIGQIKLTKSIGDSVMSLYAADTGVERALFSIYEWLAGAGGGVLSHSYGPTNIGENPPFNDVSFTAKIYCCNPALPSCCFSLGGTCQFSSLGCPLGQVLDECMGSYFCIRSVGTYKGTQRAIQVDL